MTYKDATKKNLSNVYGTYFRVIILPNVFSNLNISDLLYQRHDKDIPGLISFQQIICISVVV